MTQDEFEKVRDKAAENYFGEEGPGFIGTQTFSAGADWAWELAASGVKESETAMIKATIIADELREKLAATEEKFGLNYFKKRDK